MAKLSSFEIKSDDITVHFKRKQDEKIANIMIKTLAENIERFQKNIGKYPDLGTNIVIASSQKEYRYFTGKEKGITEFSNAFYSFHKRTIYIRPPRNISSISGLNRIVLHEYIHHFIFNYLVDAPLWFHEGMAVYFSNDLSYERELSFIKDYVLGNSLPLSKMKAHYPEHMIEWNSFYAKSALAVKYLYNSKKMQFYRFWDFAAEGDRFSEAFRKSFYFTQNDFSKFFEIYALKHFRIELLLASTGFFWSVLPFVLLIAYWRKKRKNRKIIEDWEKEEKINYE